jgi:hypothetical protein
MPIPFQIVRATARTAVNCTTAPDFKGMLREKFLPWQRDPRRKNPQKGIDKRPYAIYFQINHDFQIAQNCLIISRCRAGGKYQWQKGLRLEV